MPRKYHSAELRIVSCEDCKAYDNCLLGQVATELLIQNRDILGDTIEDLGVSFRRAMDRDASTDEEVNHLLALLNKDQREAKAVYNYSGAAIREFIRGIIDRSRIDAMLKEGAARDLRDKFLESPIGKDPRTPHLVSEEQVREAMNDVVTHQDSGVCHVVDTNITPIS